jgi:hypothetical protein
MAGIQETKDVISAGIAFGEGLGKALEDGAIGVGDIGHFIEVVVRLPEALEGINEVPVELKDLDEAELAELVTFIGEEFDIPQDEVEAKIEDTLIFMLELYRYLDKHWL